jgi:hypothetical protein
LTAAAAADNPCSYEGRPNTNKKDDCKADKGADDDA